MRWRNTKRRQRVVQKMIADLAKSRNKPPIRKPTPVEQRHCRWCHAPIIRRKGDSPAKYAVKNFCQEAHAGLWTNARKRGVPPEKICVEYDDLSLLDTITIPTIRRRYIEILTQRYPHLIGRIA